MKLMTKNAVINVGMADIAISKDPRIVLASPGLGSCLGLAVYDPVRKIAGLVHIVLPDSKTSRGTMKPGKYVDTAVPEILEQMIRIGAKKSDMVLKVAGGAKMFTLADNKNSTFNIGQRNFETLDNLLRYMKLPLKAKDIGGNEGRTLSLFTVDGRVSVRTVSRKEIEL